MLKQRFAAKSKESRDMAMRKAMVTIGAEPEERQPLACILLGSLSGAYEFTVAMIDTGCSPHQVCTQKVMKYLQEYHPESIVYVKEHDVPIDIDTCSAAGGTKVTHQMARSNSGTYRTRESHRMSSSMKPMSSREEAQGAALSYKGMPCARISPCPSASTKRERKTRTT